MRNLYRVLLLAFAALTTMAALASTASATNKALDDPDLKIVKEVGGANCPAVNITETNVTGGCLLHANSEEAGVELRKHVFFHEEHLTTCVNEFWLRLDAHGEGYILEQSMTNPPGGTCMRQPCDDEAGPVQPEEKEKVPWIAHTYEGMPEFGKGAEFGSEYLETSLCFEAGHVGPNETCEIEIPFHHKENEHRSELGYTVEMEGHGVGGFRCELLGHWNTEVDGIATHDSQAQDEVTVTHWNEG